MTTTTRYPHDDSAGTDFDPQTMADEAAPGTCPDCERPSIGGYRCDECRAAFDAAADALNADLRDI